MKTDYSNHVLAKLITAEKLSTLDNPEFIGQTGVNTRGQYKMYWRVGDEQYYFTENSL